MFAHAQILAPKAGLEAVFFVFSGGHCTCAPTTPHASAGGGLCAPPPVAPEKVMTPGLPKTQICNDESVVFLTPIPGASSERVISGGSIAAPADAIDSVHSPTPQVDSEQSNSSSVRPRQAPHEAGCVTLPLRGSAAITSSRWMRARTRRWA